MRADLAKGDAVPPMFQPDTSNLLPKIAAILITLCGAAALSWQARQLYLQMSQPQARGDEIPPRLPSLSPQLLQRLFGNTVSTTADLHAVQLQGCIVAADPRQSQALIQIEGQGAVNVFAGEEFLPGVVLQQVAHDHVLFSRNGGSGRLDFPTTQSASPALPPGGAE